MMHEERRRGLWVHWVGDAVSLVIVLGTFLVAWGAQQESNRARDERLTKIEARQEQATAQASADRRELKQDIQQQLQNIVQSIGAMDTKLTAVLIDRPRTK
jgi:uncharacterized protein HemX